MRTSPKPLFKVYEVVAILLFLIAAVGFASLKLAY
jgi:hypothetical protein